ncbi:glycoside hydrolase [Mucilaginibacter terrigena]|uniref:Glycoside hydrolase n=1 Tax=Mucilaginibacter terrigena TaxID=2492395 RepID=A0A4Q5LMR6_9SPHI|nr:glycoside hydrolase family 43 protein [Mucilaginibacter terrigena]RYU90927.1 glycoside hydrolase [Mucilaginibacter terrigena]
MKLKIAAVTFLAVFFILFKGGFIHASKTEKPAIDTMRTFSNTLINGADPWLIKDKGNYYLCLSAIVNHRPVITVSSSKKLSETGKPIVVWTAPKKAWNANCVWAPELHRIGNKWYIYYTAGVKGPPYIHQRSGVLESVTDDPQGQYVDKGMLNTGADLQSPSHTIWAIDLTVTTINKRLYAVWSGWKNNKVTDDTKQQLYMAEMKNPWTISSERMCISRPEQEWETGGPLDINEGPEFLKHNSHTFIIYSTRESWTPEYRLGQLQLKDSTKTPLDAKNWIKTGPVFQGTDQVYGVGHASFTTSPDNREWWIVYHTKKSTEPGWDREIRVQPFSWQPNGNPDFGVPVPPGKKIKLPSGEK